MKRCKALFAVFGVLLIFVTGCASTGGSQSSQAGLFREKTLQANGYGQFEDSGRVNVNDRWLYAQQSAKLNAYRGLAHQLYYESLGENKTVGSQVVQHEVYRVYLDIYLRNARATDYRTINDSLKTTLALKLTPRFYQCMGGNIAQASQCIQQDGKLPITRLGYNAAETRTINLACGRGDCSDQFYVKGFSKKRGSVDRALLNTGLYDVQWTVNTGLRILFNYLLINGFVNAL